MSRSRRDVAVAVALLVVFVGGMYALRVRWTRVSVPRNAQHAELTATVRADGSARVVVAPGQATREELLAAAPEMARELLGGQVERVRVRTSGGKPYAVVALRDVFEPGRAPIVSVDGYRTYEIASRYGWAEVGLRLDVPPTYPRTGSWSTPPTEKLGGSSWRWGADRVPNESIRMVPAPARGWATAALVTTGAAAVFAGISLWPRRRSRGRTVCGLVALACALPTPFLQSWPHGELGVSGAVSGPLLAAMHLAPFLWLAAILGGPWLLLTPRRRRRRATMRA